MGLFLGISSIPGVAEDRVIATLRKYVESVGGELRAGAEDEEIEPQYNLGVAAENGSTTLDYPGARGWEALSQKLSSLLASPVFAIHIHDDDFWMFQLYVKGVEATAFHPKPDYFGSVSSADRTRFRGDPRIVSENLKGVPASEIERYLVDRHSVDGKAKAYPDDQFPYWDFWQFLDFMKRAKLPTFQGNASVRNYLLKLPPTLI